jgi:hypothetical protein
MLLESNFQHEIAAVAHSSATHSSCSAGETGQVAAPPVIEWARNIQKIELPFEALAKMQELAESAPQPSARLRAAAKRYSR